MNMLGQLLNGVGYILLVLHLVQAQILECPLICSCRAFDVSAICKDNELTDLPEGLYIEVLRLDLSYNHFQNVPKSMSSFKSLKYLNLSHNKLSYLNSTSLEGLTALEELDLSHNLLKDWMDIHTDALTHTPSLLELDLSHNSLRGFPDIIEDYPLKSDSLETLHLINCSISNLLGDILLGITNIKRLDLSQNPLVALNTQIKSEKLHTLDLSQCSLQRIHPEAFIELISLEELILARNYQLKKFNSRSNSLKFLDLSHCNLESIPGSSLPNLTKVYFKGNHLRHIPANSFASFPLVHALDLSNNAIGKLDVKAFHGLKFVESIDLSVNTISYIDPLTFMSNLKLHKLNLSRNYLSRLGQLVIESLRWLDVSVCEIQEINRDSLIMMPKLQKLNLSRNLISQIPNRLQADELSVLDLSTCRIYTLNNLTFVSMNRLRSLSLSGNRLVSGIKPSFFHRIADVKLQDNPWFCDCNSNDFRELYTWIYYEITSSTSSALRCRSPENLVGYNWETACQEVWFTPEKTRADTMWVYSLSLIILMTLLCCVVISIRHVYHRKAVRQREAQEQEREEARERLRRIHQRNLQYSRESMNRNAPDPRELQTPPSYAEAVSMPRLNVSCSSLAGSHHSLHSLHSSHPDISSRRTKMRRKRRRSRHKASVSETQSVASLSHANTQSEVSNSEDELRPTTENRNVVIESSF